jgi:uncharacterized protein YndB with AHSA1/START domain
METIDITTHLGAIDREVHDVERDGRPARVVVAARTYDTGIDDLWDCLTNPERLPRWFLPVSGDLQVGGRYQTEGNAGGTILACERPRHLSLTWEFGGDVTWVEVTLTADGAVTRLRLEHTAHPGDHWDQFGPGAVGIGWELALLGLGAHVRTGVALDPAEVMAWQGSPAGLDLMRRMGDGWGDADVAGGADPTQAKAAADRTIEAYTTVPEA